jgi:hypothetical protein
MKKLQVIIDIKGEDVKIILGKGISISLSTVRIAEDIKTAINMFKYIVISLGGDQVSFDEEAINKLHKMIKLYNDSITPDGRLYVCYTFNPDGSYNCKFEGDLTANIITWVKAIEDIFNQESNKQL